MVPLLHLSKLGERVGGGRRAVDSKREDKGGEEFLRK